MTGAATTHSTGADAQLQRLLSYLESDPANAALRADAAERAMAVREPAIARDLFSGQDPASLGNRELGLLGLAEMQSGDFAAAAATHRLLLGRRPGDPAIAFNLAWSLAMLKEFEAALEQLTPAVTTALPQAAMLEVQVLHERGDFEAAETAARAHLERFPDDPGLAAAVSVLALDVEDRDLAEACARKAGNHPDALATLGTLALGEQRVGEAAALFDRAIDLSPHSPRPWIGRGLARLVEQDGGAAADIDRGAELFRDHLGSWIAAGWAYLIAGDLSAARNRFERALAIDDAFGEAQGSLAVVDILEARAGEGRTRASIAKRLDRSSFSAGFADVLLLQGEGDAEAARVLFDRILASPINARGDTAAAALVRLGIGR